MNARRRKLLAQAHLAAKQAGCLDEDDRRAVQHRLTGKASCRDMTEAELVRVIDHWRARGATVRASAPEAGSAPEAASRWQLATLERLALEMGWDAGLEDPALLSFVRRTARVDQVRWLSRAQASDVISGLIRWKRQQRAKG